MNVDLFVQTPVEGFPPLLCKEAKILILGTLPGKESLAHREYYYSNSNRIWKVLCRITGEQIPRTYTEKKALLARYRIGLWDYYSCAVRQGSDDNAIRRPVPNDIIGLLQANPTIDTIAVNGFSKYSKFGERLDRMIRSSHPEWNVRVLRLPETSGSNANYGWGILDNLVAEWKRIFE